MNLHNAVTGNTTTETDLLNRAKGYVAEQLTQATFQQFLAIFENFFFDLLRLWLMRYPHSLANKDLKYKVVLDAPDKDAVSLAVINKELNEIAYERLKDWFKYLDDKAKLGCPTDDEIDRLAEAKASRDVLAHNKGMVNKVYVGKAGRLARHYEGEALDLPEPYHRATWELIRKVVGDVGDAAIAKAT